MRCALLRHRDLCRRSYSTIAQHVEALKVEASVSLRLTLHLHPRRPWGVALGVCPHCITAANPGRTCAACCLQRLEALVQEVEPDIYTPDFVAEEVSSTQQAGACRQQHTCASTTTAWRLTHESACLAHTLPCTSRLCTLPTIAAWGWFACAALWCAAPCSLARPQPWVVLVGSCTRS